MSSRVPDMRVTWLSRTLDPPVSPETLRRRIAEHPGAAMLESVAQNKTFGRFSFFAWDPVREATTPHGGDGEDPFSVLKNVCRPWLRFAHPPEIPFVGGWIGCVVYDAGRFVEPTAGWRHRSRDGLPAASWRLYDTALIHDRLKNEWIAAGVELPSRLSGGHRPPLAERLDAVEQFARQAARDVFPSGPTLAAEGEWNDSKCDYVAKVERILDYIRAGDVFQVNLARGFRARLKDSPVEIYERLCRANPAVYAAYLNLRGTDGEAPISILSSSPELFLSVRDRRVTTRPIKGTRPRGRDADADRAAARELAHSEKDRAELNMIIDLERNDLGRVCEYGSVRVLDEGSIETLPTVLHRTASITGRLRADADAIDLLAAAFPGGSITGAPKVRAMQIIDELEPQARGAYCGAVGYIGVDGDMQLNLAIRTMTVAGGHAEFHVGSGIVADSDPDDEFRELNAKAAGMLAALGLPNGGAEGNCSDTVDAAIAAPLQPSRAEVEKSRG
ncbi:MAG: aminodeoxychorismate synthase component I [Planctomycetota bacterium]|nr:MAG: aminodeoxychorismate synthase component I [Planctomycetota bacterium]